MLQALNTFLDWLRLLYSETPFVRAELAYLKRNVRLSRYRTLALILAGCTVGLAFTPVLATSQYANIPFHSLIGATLMLLCLGYEIRLIALSIHAIEHEQQNQTWDSLRLTGVDASKIILAKWQAVMRYGLGITFLLTVSRFALAYSVMEYLNVYPAWIDIAINDWNRAFVYLSYRYPPVQMLLVPYPQLWQAVLAAVILALLNLANTGLLVSLGILASFIKRNLPFTRISAALLGRALLTVIGIVVLIVCGRLDSLAQLHHWFPGYTTPGGFYGCDHPVLRQNAAYYNWCVVERDRRRVFETVQVAGSALADNGVFLAANVLRPTVSWRFALRNVASAVTSWLIMAGSTLLALWFAGRLVYRQPP